MHDCIGLQLKRVSPKMKIKDFVQSSVSERNEIWVDHDHRIANARAGLNKFSYFKNDSNSIQQQPKSYKEPILMMASFLDSLEEKESEISLAKEKIATVEEEIRILKQRRVSSFVAIGVLTLLAIILLGVNLTKNEQDEHGLLEMIELLSHENIIYSGKNNKYS